MGIQFSFILLHIGNSDSSYLLIQELYRNNNILVLICKSEKMLVNLKRDFPKIDYIFCDVNVEEELKSLVKRCNYIYPFLDIIIHHNFNREISNSSDVNNEIIKSLKESNQITKGFLPSLKAKSSIIHIGISTEKKAINDNGIIQPSHFSFEDFLPSIRKQEVNIHQTEIPICMLKLQNQNQIKLAKEQIIKILLNFSKVKTKNKRTEKSPFSKRLKKLLSNF